MKEKTCFDHEGSGLSYRVWPHPALQATFSKGEGKLRFGLDEDPEVSGRNSATVIGCEVLQNRQVETPGGTEIIIDVRKKAFEDFSSKAFCYL